MVITVKNPIPKRVKCTFAGSDVYQKGITYYVAKNQKVIDKDGACITCWDSNVYGDSRFEPIYTEEELLEYAAKMYPISTKYRGIDSEGIPGDITSEAEDEYPQHNSCGIYVGYRYVYIHGTKQWADIITEKKETVVEEFIETPKFTAEHPDILEAKKRYPVGTKFHPAHLPSTISHCVVEESDIFQINSDGNILLSNGNQEKNGHVFSEIVRADGIWAKIVKPEVSEKYLKVREEYLTELGNPWYSLVGYKLQTLKGNIVTIVKHDSSGYVFCDDKNDYDVHEMAQPYCMKYKLVKVLANSNPNHQNPATPLECYPGTAPESFTLQMEKDLTMAWKEEFNRAFSTPIYDPIHSKSNQNPLKKPKYPSGFSFTSPYRPTIHVIDYWDADKNLYFMTDGCSITEENITKWLLAEDVVEEVISPGPIKLIRKKTNYLKQSKIVACTTIPIKLSKTSNK